MAKPSTTEDEHNFIKELDESVYDSDGEEPKSSYVSYWITKRKNVNSKTVLSDTDFTFKLMKKLNVALEYPFLTLPLKYTGDTAYDGLLDLLRIQEMRELIAAGFIPLQLPSCSSSLTSDASVQTSNLPPVKTNLSVDTLPSPSFPSDAWVSSLQERFQPVSVTPKMKKAPVNQMDIHKIEAEINKMAEKMDIDTLLSTFLNYEYIYERYLSKETDLEAAAITKLQRNSKDEFRFFKSIPQFCKQDHTNLLRYSYKYAREYKNKFSVEDDAQYSNFIIAILAMKFPDEAYGCIPASVMLSGLPRISMLFDICFYFELVWIKYKSYEVPENCDIHPPWSEILKQQSTAM